MKYLQTFENLDNILYKKIDYDPEYYVEAYKRKLIDISDRAISVINKYINNYRIISGFIAKKHCRGNTSDGSYNYEIMELQDEWFLISLIRNDDDECTLYICDQLEGLDRYLYDYYDSLFNYSDWIIENKSKIFESTNSPFYKKIEPSEYFNIPISKWLNISQEAIDIVKRNFNDVSISSGCDYKFVEFDFNSNDNTTNEISELQHEWFIVILIDRDKFNNSYYKCDQVEGLEKCLKDYINNKLD